MSNYFVRQRGEKRRHSTAKARILKEVDMQKRKCVHYF